MDTNPSNATNAAKAANPAASADGHASGSARARFSSKQRQEEFMQDIADRLRRERVAAAPNHPFRGVPDFWKAYTLDQEDRINMFMNNWTALGGHAFRMQSMTDVKQFIAEFVQETEAKKVLLQNQPELQSMQLAASLSGTECIVWDSSASSLLSDAAQADIGIAIVDHAAAYTGTVVALSAPEQGRSTSLLPKAFIAIVPAGAIEANLGPILKGMDAKPIEELPAGIHFITGPSRSSDIENDLTIGVHGPGIVYALVVG